MHGRLVLLGAIAMLALGTGAGGAVPSGLHGTVTRSPSRPVCVEGRPCSEPASRLVLVFRRDGRVVARTTTTTTGAYRVALRRGTYAISIPGYQTARLVPGRARVVPGRITRVDFSLETGRQ